jgi:hypothetical protein
VTDSYVNKEYVVRLEALVEQLEAEVTRLRDAIEWALGQADCFNEKIMIELRRKAKEGWG